MVGGPPIVMRKNPDPSYRITDAQSKICIMYIVAQYIVYDKDFSLFRLKQID